MDANQLQQLITATRQGDTQAFRQIVETFSDMVFALAMRMLGNKTDAEDIVQNVFVAVWTHIDRYQADKGSFKTWLYTLSTRQCLDVLKQRKKRQTMEIPSIESKGFANLCDGQHQLENAEWSRIIQLLTQQLSDKQRLVFTLLLLEGISVAEVKTITGMTAAKIKSHLYVARKKMQQQINQINKNNE